MATLIVGILMVVVAFFVGVTPGGSLLSSISGIVGFGMIFIGIDLIHLKNLISPPPPSKKHPAPQPTAPPTV